MRISDWSSDVCSSDLQLLQRLNEARRVPAVDDAVIATDREVHAFGADDIVALEHRPLDDLVGADDRDLRAVDHRRSEEHTSELQSLMRISYAVFCLKKKNTPAHICNR